MVLAASNVSADSWMFLRVLRARLATERASGSDISSARRAIAGLSSGMKVVASWAWSMSLHMLSAMTHTRRLLSIFFSWQPRRRMGTAIDSAGLSTDCTNTVEDSLGRGSGTSLGFSMASITAGMKGRMSLFWQVSRHLRVASLAACFTSFLVSHIAADTTGTTWYSVRAKGASDCSANWPRRRRDHILVCQLVSAMPAKRNGCTFLAAYWLQMPMIEGPAASAAARTSFDFLSATADSTLGRKGTMKGSALKPTSSQMVSMARSAASEVARSPSNFLMVSTTPHSLKARTPAASISLASFSASAVASAPVLPPRVARHALMSSPPLISSPDIAADMNSTLSNELVLGSALRASKEPDLGRVAVV